MHVNYVIALDLVFRANEKGESILFCAQNAIFIFQIVHALNTIAKKVQKADVEYVICVIIVKNAIKW